MSVGNSLDKLFENVDLGGSVVKVKPRTKYGQISSLSQLGKTKATIESSVADIRQRLTEAGTLSELARNKAAAY